MRSRAAALNAGSAWSAFIRFLRRCLSDLEYESVIVEPPHHRHEPGHQQNRAEQDHHVEQPEKQVVQRDAEDHEQSSRLHCQRPFNLRQPCASILQPARRMAGRCSQSAIFWIRFDRLFRPFVV